MIVSCWLWFSRVQARWRAQEGFTVVELLSASLLTLCFFGWLTMAYVTVTRAALTWHADWVLATETHRALARLTREVEEAVVLEAVSSAGVTLTRPEGRLITYAQRPDGVYRNDQPLGRLGVTVTTLQLTGLWRRLDPLVGHHTFSEEPPELTAADTTFVPPGWLRIVVVGQAKMHTYTAQTLVRCYNQHPVLLRERANPDALKKGVS